MLIESQIELPEAITYGLHSVKVVVDDGAFAQYCSRQQTNLEDYMGVFDEYEMTIYIRETLSSGVRVQILFHELFHFACCIAGTGPMIRTVLDSDASDVHEILEESYALGATVLLGILTTNPELKALI